MFAVVKVIRFMPCPDGTIRLNPRPPLASKMGYFRLRIINHLPASLTSPKAVIGVFLVGKKTFVKITDLRDKVITDQHTGPGNTLDFVGFVLIHIAQCIPGKTLVFREPGSQAKEIRNHIPGTGLTSPAWGL